MRVHKILSLSILFFLINAGCEKYNEQEKYKRPDWLPGKLYTTVSVQENLSLFTECLKLAGLDSILDVSGSWSVFAPTDEAIEKFLSENQYGSISEIPTNELIKITEYHVIQNPWSIEQLQNLSIYGWRTGSSNNVNSYAYKRQTMYKNPIEKYWVKKTRRKEMIVSDSTVADSYKKVFIQSRKYVPIFYDAYLDINALTSEDFSYYFNRPYERGNIYYAGAKVIRGDIFAENGFVHIIDRVVAPLSNAKELLEKDYPGESYKLFLEMVYWYYPEFMPNITATYNQPEVRYGGAMDTLWDLNYNNLAFALHSEQTGYEGPDANHSLVRQNGLFVPTDEAFRNFIDNILTVKSGFAHWPDYKSLPQDVADFVIAQNMKSSPLYPSSNQFRSIFRNKSRFQQDEENIIRKEFGSNCTFIGMNNYTPDRVFTSVTGPVFCRPEYTIFRLALQFSGTHNDIANHNGELYFFPINDYALQTDSSLLLNWINQDEYRYNFRVYNRAEQRMESQNSNTIRRRILNQVGTALPNGSANKEFIRTLGGNYITWDHTNNTIQGTLPSTFGYNGYNRTTNTPVPLSEPTDNGKVWSVNYWFNFLSSSMQTILSDYTEFYSLLNQAGLVDETSSELRFIEKGENYTVFVPSDLALKSFRVDTLNKEDLRRYLKNHFIKGEIIFTDNKKPSGRYFTANGETLDIRTGPDIIEISDKTGKPYIRIREKENATNIMATEFSTVTSVVHEIDKALTNF